MTIPSPSIDYCESGEAPTKKVCKQLVPVLRPKGTATLCPPKRSEYLQKRTQFFGRQSARFFQNSAHANKCRQILLSKLKVEIGSTKSKDNVSAHYYNDIIEQPKRRICLTFRFGNNNSCVFSSKKFELLGNQIVLTEIVDLNHRQLHHLYKNRYYVANKCELFESNYDV